MDYLVFCFKKQVLLHLRKELPDKTCAIVRKILQRLFDICCELKALDSSFQSHYEIYAAILFNKIANMQSYSSLIQMRNTLLVTFMLMVKMHEEPEIKDLNALFAHFAKMTLKKFNQLEVDILNTLEWALVVSVEEINKVQAILTDNTERPLKCREISNS